MYEVKHDIYSLGTKAMAFAGIFIMEALEHLIQWFIVMALVIFTDLVSALAKCWRMGEHIRVSRGLRDTMSKSVTYFSFVVMMVFLNTALKDQYNLDKWAILFVCFVEGCSIINNMLKPKGYEINLNAIISIVLDKLGFKTNDDIIKKD